ncbi:Rha family transcriptional regulator [Xanthomonas euvesicatoria]|uniref:Rha family transcriptional regulator n=1 Tax=Xanthomonas euvesicatoria TaxID=456327 RepID=UPI0030C816C9
MSQLTIAGDAPAITSREIAELVNSRHDSVKRTIERLAESGVIESPPTVEIRSATNTGTAYQFAGEQGKRNSIVVVAQLSPEFTTRLVDRWQELERQVAAPVEQPANHSDQVALLSLLTHYTDRVGGPPAGAISFNKASLKPFSGLRTRSVPWLV